MAEKNENDSENEEEGSEKASGGMKKIIIIAVLGILLIGGSVGATLYFFGAFDDESEVVAEEGEGEPVDVKMPAIYFPIKPPFIVNFQSRGRQRFLQVSVTVMSREQDAIDAIQTHSPLIKNRLVMLFSGEVYEELYTDEGRELLRLKTLTAIQKLLEQEIGKPGIEQVLFENFVMQ